ncbi:AAA family ATPase [Sphaerimonospora thailandensis]|uniref:ATPase n=1 Tax=Sphaerimonospora thailandensis TaxID=795644 RepID=A0A8J3VZN0_9ACTN|nr:ATP-binding protein [Sphaerimonospora thailandensis]GIH70637.1 hypothetical protein Mth01_28900 [Sphaerimonospora thailandensis]
MITRIEIDGFKSFLDFQLDIPPFLLIVGRNGSGKSNLFDALRFMSDVVRNGVQDALLGQPRGVARDLFHRDETGQVADEMRIVIGMIAASPYGPLALRCGVRFRWENGAPTARYAAVWASELENVGWVDRWRTGDAVRETLRSSRDAYLADGNPDYVPFTAGPDSLLLSLLRGESATWPPLALDPAVMRTPAQAPDRRPLQTSGENLAAVLHRLLGEDRLWRVGVDLAAIIPGVSEIVSVFDSRRQEADFDVVFREGARTPPPLLSDGTLRAIAILTALHDKDSGSTLAIEEVENGLHPSRIGELVRRLRREVSDPSSDVFDPLTRQVLLTTHSPVLLSEFRTDFSGSVVFFDPVLRVSQGKAPSTVTVARPVAESGEKGTYVSPRQVRRVLSYVQQDTL